MKALLWRAFNNDAPPSGADSTNRGTSIAALARDGVTHAMAGEAPVKRVLLAGDLACVEPLRGCAAAAAAAASYVARKAERDGAAADDSGPIPAVRGVYDLAVVGAGPAGLAAGLRAKALGLSVVVFEQGELGASIHALAPGTSIALGPRHPAGSELWLADCRKEILLHHWRENVRIARLNLHEHEAVLRLEVRPGVLHLFTGAEERLARYAILATGGPPAPAAGLKVEPAGPGGAPPTTILLAC